MHERPVSPDADRTSKQPLTPDQRARVAANLNLARWAVRRYYPDVCPGGPDADDAVGVACLGLVYAARRFDPGRGSFPAYALYWCRAYLNRWWVERARSGLRLAGPAARVGRLGGGRPYDESPPARVADLDGPLDVETVLAGLSPRSRATLTLTFLEGRTLAEAGRELGVSGEGVRQIRQRAVALLRKQFGTAV